MPDFLASSKSRLKSLYVRVFHNALWEMRAELQEHPERFEVVNVNGEQHIRRKKGD